MRSARFAVALSVAALAGCDATVEPPPGVAGEVVASPRPLDYDPRLAVDLPAGVREWYRNWGAPHDGSGKRFVDRFGRPDPQGSCVQCSIGMIGAAQNVPAASTLLWQSEYGPPVWGGSWPDRVERYARQRNIAIYSVTGAPTWEWMRWACRTGRGAAIGAGSAHFQTLVGHDPQRGLWYVCNNNSPQRVDVYDDAAFRRLHLASGQWCVILASPPAPHRAAFDPNAPPPST